MNLAERISQIELDLKYSPDDGELLGEYASALLQAREHERVIEVCQQMLTVGDTEDRELAHVQWAEALFELKRHDEAETVLDSLRKSSPGELAAEGVAELYAERGDHRKAVRWFNIALSHYSDAELRDVENRSIMLNVTLLQRRDCRQALGLSSDFYDDAAIEMGQ